PMVGTLSQFGRLPNCLGFWPTLPTAGRFACLTKGKGLSSSSPTRTRTWNKPVNRTLLIPAEKRQKYRVRKGLYAFRAKLQARLSAGGDWGKSGLFPAKSRGGRLVAARRGRAAENPAAGSTRLSSACPTPGPSRMGYRPGRRPGISDWSTRQG